MARETYSPSYLTVPGGRIAYDVEGTGPLVVLVPGMGDLRSTYRYLAPDLVSAGFRVAATDLRGHGDSDPSFERYGDAETAGDVAALITELGGPAVIVGNSMGAAAAVLVAAGHPDLISGLVLIGPFVRNGESTPLKRLALRVAMARPWAAGVWRSYLPKLYAGRRPADFEEHRSRIAASLARPRYRRAFSLTTRADHADAEASLDRVATPTLVIMGDQDPDFADPEAEAAWIAEHLAGEMAMVAAAGHYPQSQQPELTSARIIEFLTGPGAGA